MSVLRWLGGLAETRLTGTKDEKRVQRAIADRLEAAGYQISWQEFRFPRQIYGNIALHYGLAILLVALPWPRLAAVGHLVIFVSFVSEATRRGHVLRRLWPTIDTQNLVATFRSLGPVKKRIVFVAHVDSAFTGLVFHPPVLKVIAAPPPKALPFLRKQMVPLLFCVLMISILEFTSLYVPVSRLWSVLLCVPMLPMFFFMFDVLVRNQPVPGAGDNLTGCAAQVVLAETWAQDPPRGVEVVFAFTGAEEAGTGGAIHLARTMRTAWDPTETQVIALDTLSNGDLFQLEEGELYRIARPPALVRAVDEAAAKTGHDPIPPYIVPVGGTDALAFLAAGYDALALTCVDPEQHAPRHYHHPSDTVENIDPVQLDRSMEVAQALLEVLAEAGPEDG